MSFTTTKDRVWVAYDVFAGWLARRSMPVRKAGYGIFGTVLWAAYLWPGGTVRPTIASLAHHAGHPSQRRLFSDYVRGFLRGMNRTEQVRHGRTDAVDAMFRLPDKSRLDAIMEQGGCVLVIPHTHASLAMGRGLARHYDLLALLRSTGNERRAASERQIYANLDCDWLDIRVENATKVEMNRWYVFTKAIKVFDEVKADYFITAGTLLGMARDCKLFDYDLDFTIAIDWAKKSDNLERLLEGLKSAGFHSVRSFMGHDHTNFTHGAERVFQLKSIKMTRCKCEKCASCSGVWCHKIIQNK